MSFVHRIGELLAEGGSGLTDKAAHWERVPLGAVAEVINGFPFSSGGFNNEKVGEAVVRIRDVTSGQVSTYFNGSVAGVPRISHGDLVIGMDGDFNSRLWPGDAALMNQRVCKVVPDERFYSKVLLAYALPGYLKLVNDHTSAITVKHLSSRTVQDIPLPLPPRAEQDRLASKLDELFSRIDEGERALERVSKLVERYRQSVLKAAVTGELTRDWREARKAAGQPIESGEALLTRILTARREAWEQAELAKMQAKGATPKGDSWKQEYKEPLPLDVNNLSELPEGWAWASAESVCESVHSGTTPERSFLKATETRGVPFIKVYNLTMDGTLDFSIDPTFVDEDHHRKKMVRSCTLPGDVLTNIVGPPLGKVSLVPNTYPEWNINQAVAAFRPRNCLLNGFLSIYLQSEVAQSWLRATTKTTTSQVNLAITTCRRLPVPVPPLFEQSRICDEVERLLSNVGAAASTAHGSMRTSDALRQSVLKSAFKGELEAQDPTDEPASALLERIALERVTSHNTAAPKRGRKKKCA